MSGGSAPFAVEPYNALHGPCAETLTTLGRPVTLPTPPREPSPSLRVWSGIESFPVWHSLAESLRQAKPT